FVFFFFTFRLADGMTYPAQNSIGSCVKSSSIAPPHPTSSPCPAGYISWYRNCYKLVEEPATWDAAQKACEQHGANLVSIDMSYDQAFVAGVVLQGKADAWIGLRLKDDGSFAWTDGWPVFFTQWGPGEPDNLKDEVAEENCVEMYPDGRWNDNDCLQKRGFVCRHRQCKHSDGSRVASASWQPLKTGLCCLFVIRLHHRRWRKPRFPHRWAKC
uniref:C-type lectin domain-containing protein n=1 Tax=Hippocampus comes TaxID=109280 RepID=A0A3Q2Z7V2_HIPCM